MELKFRRANFKLSNDAHSMKDINMELALSSVPISKEKLNLS